MGTIVQRQHGPTPLEMVCLRLGGAVRLRPIRPDDEARLRRLWPRLSPTTIYRRFLSPRPCLPAAEVWQLVHVDYRDRYAVVALLGDEIVGVGRFHRQAAASEAEIALLVEDAWQRRGLGRALLDHLIRAATARDISVFSGTVLGENQAVIALLARTFADVAFRLEYGEYVMRASLVSAAHAAAG